MTSLPPRSERSALRPLVLAALLADCASVAAAADIRVHADYPTIQQAVDASSDGDHILVAEGEYRSVDFHGHSVQLLATGRRWMTLISGAGNFHSVAVRSGEHGVVIAGFALQYGDAEGTEPDDQGGGVLVAGGSSVEIRDNVVSRNHACLGGAGIAVVDDGTFAWIHDNRVDHNSIVGCGSAGAGIEVLKARAVIEHNFLHGNEAWEDGGGIGLLFAGPTLIERNKIYRNTARGSGGGISSIESDEARIADNLIVGNEAARGGGVFLKTFSRLSKLTLVNDTLANNTGDEFDADASAGGAIDVYNTIFSSSRNTDTSAVCVGGQITLHDTLHYAPDGATFSGGCTIDGVSLVTDPRFAGETGSLHDYWLQPDSPAIDVGSTVRHQGRQDLTGAPRVSGPSIDLGAIEFRQD
jgi:hypothetical protein